MPLDTPPPTEVWSRLPADCVRDTPLFAVQSDLNHDRRFTATATWLFVTARVKDGSEPLPVAAGRDALLDAALRRAAAGTVTLRLLALEDRELSENVSLADLEEVRLEERLGGGSLMARFKKREGETVAEERRLAWFTKTMAPDLGVFARVVNDLRENRKAELPEFEGPAVCPKCGRPLEERGGSCPHCVNVFKVFSRLLGYLSEYRWRVALLLAATILSVGAQVVTPLFQKYIIDDVIIPKRPENLAFWIGLTVAAATFVLFTKWYSAFASSWLAARVVANLRTRLHAHLQRLRLGYFHKREAGEVTSRVMHDTQELQQFLIDGLPYLVVNSVLFVAVAVILIALDPWLAICVFVPVPIMLFGIRWIWVRLHSLFHKDGSLHGRLFSVLGESVRGVKAVKAASREDDRSGVFANVNQNIVNTTVRIDRQYAAFSEGTSWVFALAFAAVWYFASRRIVGTPPDTPNALTLGDLLAYSGFIGMFYGPLGWFSVIANWMNHASAAAERIFAVLDTPEEIYEAPNAVMPGRLKGHIVFDHVRFSYDRGKEVIKDVSLDIKPGEMIGLVGKSGAGKSTMVNLLCRFYETDAGEIRIDGTPIKRFRLDGLRRQIGFVMQDPFLFRASLFENIRYGAPDATFEEVVRAAKAAHAHDFIVDKEFGYDTIVGDGGADLSGGERQRIAIARALLHDPPILILDEATSSVDSETEKRIQDALATLVRGRTVIAIAHRLATLRNARLLVVMEEGRVAEKGTHDQLMASGGIYSGLVKTQTELNRLREEQHLL